MKEKTQDKKAAALQATLELISEQGFHGTPMSQIAQRANIGVGTIYRYFPSKEDLINVLYMNVKTRFAQYIVRNFSENMPIREGFLILFCNIADFYIENPVELFFMEQYSNSPLITAATREESLLMFTALIELFQRGKNENLLKDLPMELLGTLAYEATIGLVKLYLSGREAIDKKDLDDGIAAIWDAIKK